MISEVSVLMTTLPISTVVLRPDSNFMPKIISDYFHYHNIPPSPFSLPEVMLAQGSLIYTYWVLRAL